MNQRTRVTPDPVVADEDIRNAVQQHYAARAREVSSCCGPATACCAPDADRTPAGHRLYSEQEVAEIADSAVQGSLGCGNPTALAELKPGEVVVDLGSGGGIDVFLAARQVGEAGFVYGIDMTDDMLNLARRNAAQMGVANVEFRKGHIEALPLPDQCADVILSNCVINLSPDKDKTLAEALRVLAPGGRLAVSDIVVDGVLDDLPVSEAEIRAALNWVGCIAGALTMDAYRAALTAAGFEQIEIEIVHRYALQDLGQDVDALDINLSPETAAALIDRFTSCNISAVRPSITGQ